MKKRKNPDPHGDLANPSTKKDKSNESSIAELAESQKFNLSRCTLENKSALSPHQICKGKSAMEPSNNTIEHMDIVNQIMENPFNHTTVTELAKSQNFSLSRCCQLKKQSALSPNQICKVKSVMEPSINITEDMDTIDQAIGIFQEEIIMEILSRLPVWSLHRFKCVSKFWMALISDPYFKKKHLNRAKNDKKFQKLLAAKVSPDKVYMYSCSSLSSVPLVEDEQKLNFPLNVRRCRHCVLCSCDGLVLVAVFVLINDGGFDEHLLLWNPSTRESKVLPHPGRRLCEWLFGLGYDTSSNDYKILALNLNYLSLDLPGVLSKIIALKSGSWRYCKYPTGVCGMFGNVGSGMDSLAFMHGTFHWLGLKNVCYKPIIVTFDISNEVFGEILLPDNFPFGYQLDCGVSVLGGKLCCYVASYRVLENDPFWEMKDYGVKESWTSLLTIQDTDRSRVARPQYRYADGEVLLHCKTKTSADFIYRRTRGPFELLPSKLIVAHGIAYTESLISPRLLT